MKPMKAINLKVNLPTLKRRAKKHGIMIQKYGLDAPDNENYMLVDAGTALVFDPYPMTLEQIDQWLDDLDDSDKQAD